jgi:hypothetical protein
VSEGRESRRTVTDLNEAPAVPPEDRGGDERIGYRAGGILLVVVGWGFGIVLNLLVHWTAPTTGRLVGPWHVYPTFGVYALGALGLGVVAGVVGVFMLWLGQRSARGKFVLPGASY